MYNDSDSLNVVCWRWWHFSNNWNQRSVI